MYKSEHRMGTGMRRYPVFILGLCCLTVLAAVFSCVVITGRSKAAGGEGSVILVGKVSVKGSEPNTYLALTAEDGTVYELAGEKAGELRDEYQGRLIEVRGMLVKEAVGPGMPARVEIMEYKTAADK